MNLQNDHMITHSNVTWLSYEYLMIVSDVRVLYLNPGYASFL